MNEEKIMEAVGFIDDSLIEEADKLRNQKKSFPYRKLALLAACLILLTAGSIFAYPALFTDSVESGDYGYSDKEMADDASPVPEASYDIEDEETRSDDISNNTIAPSSDIVLTESATALDLSDSAGVIVKIDKWLDNGFICTVAEEQYYEGFEHGTELTVYFESSATVGTVTEEDEITTCNTPPTEKFFPVGSTVLVLYSDNVNISAALSDSEPAVYTEMILKIETAK